MSWHFLQGSEAASWEGKSLAGAPDALSRLIPIAGAFSSPGNATESLTPSPSGTTSRPLTAAPGGAQSTSFQGDSPARISAHAAKGQELKARSPACGKKWPELSARSDQASPLLKTPPCWQIGAWASSSAILPRWGIMLHGELFRLKIAAFPTSAKDCGFRVPTPKKGLIEMGFKTKLVLQDRYGAVKNGLLAYMLKRFHCQLTPMATEYLMGFPISWTDLAPLEMHRFLLWLQPPGDF